MRVRVDYNDGTEPEEIDVTPGSMHFHPYPEGDTERHDVTIEVLGVDPLAAPEPEEYDPDAPDVEYSDEEGYDPGEHTVTEVIGYVEDNPQDLEEVLAAEEAGKARVTLISHLESMRPES
jgi:hypothetical protein